MKIADTLANDVWNYGFARVSVVDEDDFYSVTRIDPEVYFDRLPYWKGCPGSYSNFKGFYDA